MCRKTQMQANLKIRSFKLLVKIWKLSISCHLPLCNLAGSIWWLQEGKDLGNKGSLPNRKGRWRTLRPWHCLWIFKLFIQTTDTFFSSFMKCLLLKFFFSIILSENCLLFFSCSQPHVTNSQNLALHGTSLLNTFTCAYTPYLLNLIHFLKFCTGLLWQSSG